MSDGGLVIDNATLHSLSSELSGLTIELLDLEGAAIEKRLHFERCIFLGITNFENAQISRNMSFSECEFRGPVNFRGASTPNRLRFSTCTFEQVFSLAAGNTAISGSRDLWHLRIESCKFKGYVTFNNRELHRSVVFKRCEFAEPPSLLNVKTHSGLDLEDCVLNVPLEKKLLRRAERSFRALRLHANENDDNDLEAELIGLALDCRRRNPDNPRPERLLIVLYWAISDYGRSVIRPFVAALTVVIAVCLALLYLDGGWNESALTAAVYFSLQQIFNPYSALSPSYIPPDGLAIIAQKGMLILPVLGILVSSTVFVALVMLGFAIRRRFDR